MSFYLSKARIMTSHQQLANYFSTIDKFKKTLLQFLPAVDIDVTEQIKSIQVRHLESAFTTYALAVQGQPVNLQIVWMQSTSKTAYCFDVIFQVAPHDYSVKIPEVELLLESIRKKHNKHRIIEDHHLDDAALR